MGYGLGAGEATGAGLQRILVEELEAAAEAMENARPDPVEATHRARKCLKKARTVARLIRDQRPRAAARALKLARDAGRALAGRRDGDVIAARLAELARPRERATIDRVVRRLGRGVDASASDCRRWARRLRALARQVRAWASPVLDDDALVAALRQLARRERRARRAAQASGKNADHHEWRKRAKDLWYAERLLAVPRRRALEAALRSLAERLGDEHDWSLVVARLGGAAIERRWRKRAAAKQAAARASATALAARWLASAPRKFAENAIRARRQMRAAAARPGKSSSNSR